MKSLKKITPFLWYLPVKILKKHTEYELHSISMNLKSHCTKKKRENKALMLHSLSVLIIKEKLHLIHKHNFLWNDYL